jgi:isopentenyl diphosphate isomerase/L-lactate dehydrogenase-like FMN-dependent dehydrogenase
MDWKSVQINAKEKLNGVCRICSICNGIVCTGEVPGMGGLGSGVSFRNNIGALAKHQFNLRTIHDINHPELSSRVLGIDLSVPILGAAIGGISINVKGCLTEAEYNAAVVNGCAQVGAISMTADGPSSETFESGITALASAHGRGIPIIKPRDTKKIIELATRAAAAGAPAFGIDIDAAALINMTN